MRLDVLVIGGLNWDHFALGDRFPGPGQTVRGSRYLQAPGGKGANLAIAAARLGRSVALVGRIGDDAAGREARLAVVDAGIDTSDVHVTQGVATGTAVIQVGGRGEKRIVAVPGANAQLTEKEVRAACARFPDPRVAILSLECGLPAVKAVMSLLKPAGCAVLLDPSPAEDPLENEVLGGVYLIKPDAHEAQALTGVSVTDTDSARQAAKQLLKQGAGAVVVQAGDAGDLLVEQSGAERFFPRLKVEAVDATGAGDAYLGTIAAYLADNRDLPSAVLAGSAGAALATRALGAQASLAQPGEIERLLASRPLG